MMADSLRGYVLTKAEGKAVDAFFGFNFILNDRLEFSLY